MPATTRTTTVTMLKPVRGGPGCVQAGRQGQSGLGRVVGGSEKPHRGTHSRGNINAW